MYNFKVFHFSYSYVCVRKYPAYQRQVYAIQSQCHKYASNIVIYKHLHIHVDTHTFAKFILRFRNQKVIMESALSTQTALLILSKTQAYLCTYVYAVYYQQLH